MQGYQDLYDLKVREKKKKLVPILDSSPLEILNVFQRFLDQWRLGNVRDKLLPSDASPTFHFHFYIKVQKLMPV